MREGTGGKETRRQGGKETGGQGQNELIASVLCCKLAQRFFGVGFSIGLSLSSCRKCNLRRSVLWRQTVIPRNATEGDSQQSE